MALHFSRQSKGGEAPFVGREEELGWLGARYSQARNKQAGLVFLAGEAGVGKTRLLNEFGRLVEDSGGKAYYGRCQSLENPNPYTPFTDALQEHMGTDYSQEEESEDFASMGMVGMSGQDEAEAGIDDSVPMGMIGLGGGLDLTSQDDSTTIEAKDLGGERDKMFNTISHMLQTVSKKAPLVLMLDDFQWVDTASMQLLHFIAQNIQESQILIICSYRPEDIEVPGHLLLDSLKKMRVEKLFEELLLGRFNLESARYMIKGALGAENLSDGLVEKIFQQSEGNPFFINEVLTNLISSNLVQVKGNTAEIQVELSQLHIPDSLRDVVSDKLSGLSPDCVKILQHASILGDNIHFDVMLDVTQFLEMKLIDLLEELMELKLLHENPNTTEEIFSFEHKVIREVIYNGMSRPRRRLMHKEIALIMDMVFARKIDEVIFSLTHHCFIGRIYDKCAKYSFMSAKKSQAKYAMDDAVSYYKQAIAMVAQLEETDELRTIRTDSLMAVAQLTDVIGQWNDAIGFYLQARDSFETAGDMVRVAEAYRKIGDIYAMHLTQWEKAEEFLTKALDISEEEDDEPGIADSHRGLGYIHWRTGELDDAVSHYNMTIERAVKIGDNHIMAITFIDLGNVFNMTGRVEKSKEYYLKALEHLEDLERQGKVKDYAQMARAHNNLGDLNLQHEEWDEALKNFHLCRQLSEKIGNLPMVGWAYFNSGEAYVKSNQLDSAKEALDKARDILSKLDEPMGMAGVYENYGTLYTRQEKWVEAQKYYEMSLAAFEKMETPYEVGRVSREYATMFMLKGDHAKSKKILDRALRSFKKVGAERDVAKVRNEMSDLDKASKKPKPDVETETEPDPTSEPEAKSKTEPDSDIKSKSATEAESDPATDPTPDTEDEPDPAPGPTPDTETDAESEPAPEPSPDAELESTSKADAGSEPEPEPSPDAEPESTSKADAGSEPEPEPSPDAEPESTSKADSESELESDLPPDTDAEPEPTSKADADSEPESGSAPGHEPEPEIGSESESEPESEPKSEPEPDDEPDFDSHWFPGSSDD